MKISECLKELRQNGPGEPDGGICNNIPRRGVSAGAIWHVNKNTCFTEWEEFSGDLMYPVPSFSSCTPGHRFNIASEQTMWDRYGEYGAARWRLLDHCINWFEGIGE